MIQHALKGPTTAQVQSQYSSPHPGYVSLSFFTTSDTTASSDPPASAMACRKRRDGRETLLFWIRKLDEDQNVFKRTSFAILCISEGLKTYCDSCPIPMNIATRTAETTMRGPNLAILVSCGHERMSQCAHSQPPASPLRLERCSGLCLLSTAFGSLSLPLRPPAPPATRHPSIHEAVPRAPATQRGIFAVCHSVFVNVCSARRRRPIGSTTSSSRASRRSKQHLRRSSLMRPTFHPPNDDDGGGDDDMVSRCESTTKLRRRRHPASACHRPSGALATKVDDDNDARAAPPAAAEAPAADGKQRIQIGWSSNNSLPSSERRSPVSLFFRCCRLAGWWSRHRSSVCSSPTYRQHLALA